MKSRELYKAIQRTLLTDWDPIGIRDVTAAHDEYDQYIGAIEAALTADASATELSTHLLAIEANLMGLRPNEKRARYVAEILRSLV